MKVALVCVCPDAKQRAHLELVWPTWEAYARRHALEIVVLGRSGRPADPYWGKYFPLDDAALRRFDAALVLDNDIVINPQSPSILEHWDGQRVLIGDEREQFGWPQEYVRRYFASYELPLPPQSADLRVYNTGVLVYTREHLPVFRDVHERWRAWRDAAPTDARVRDAFKYANDQPHVGLALQSLGIAQLLDVKFNRLWWNWWLDHGRRSEWPSRDPREIRRNSRWVADTFNRPWARRRGFGIDRAIADNHFLHFAGSKSPLLLLAHRSSRGEPQLQHGSMRRPGTGGVRSVEDTVVSQMSSDPTRRDLPPMRRTLLVIELWGLGVLTMATPLLAAAADTYDVTLLAKPHARALLSATFPRMTFIEWEAPWTAFTGKCRWWRWKWRTLRAVVAALRQGRFDVAVSSRPADPRDHLLMWLAGIPRRIGYPYRRTPGLLTDSIDDRPATRHVVEDWRALADRLGLNDTLEPRLNGSAYPATFREPTGKPVLGLHAGARMPVRRWPEAYFAETIRRLRTRFDFDLLLIPDPDGYGLGLSPLADRVIEALPLPDLGAYWRRARCCCATTAARDISLRRVVVRCLPSSGRPIRFDTRRGGRGRSWSCAICVRIGHARTTAAFPSPTA
jgi:hypothetical protein